MSEDIDRRHFVGAAAMTFAAAKLGIAPSGKSGLGNPSMVSPGTHTSFGPLKQINGTTRFLASDTFRNGQQSVVALNIIALMDSIKIQKAIVGGYDWGSRTADIIGHNAPQESSQAFANAVDGLSQA
jgi:hypothetical protein